VDRPTIFWSLSLFHTSNIIKLDKLLKNNLKQKDKINICPSASKVKVKAILGMSYYGCTLTTIIGNELFEHESSSIKNVYSEHNKESSSRAGQRAWKNLSHLRYSPLLNEGKFWQLKNRVYQDQTNIVLWSRKPFAIFTGYSTMLNMAYLSFLEVRAIPNSREAGLLIFISHQSSQ
jgi:hypothetical protein